MTLEFLVASAIGGASLAAVRELARPKIAAHLIKSDEFESEAQKLDLDESSVVCSICDSSIDESEARIIRVRASDEPLIVCNRTECLLAYTRSDSDPLQKTLPTSA